MGRPAGPGEIYCSTCRTVNSDGGNYCTHCGSALSKRETIESASASLTVVCHDCGENNRTSSEYCFYCGESLHGDRHVETASIRTKELNRGQGRNYRSSSNEAKSRPSEVRRGRSKRWRRSRKREANLRYRKSEWLADSALRAIIVAAVLGVTGVFGLAVVFFIGLIVGAILQMPVVPTLAFSAAIGQIVGFVGLAVAYLRYRGHKPRDIIRYLGLRYPTRREIGLVIAGNLSIIAFFAVLIGISELLSVVPNGDVSNTEPVSEEFGIGLFLGLVGFMLIIVGPTEEVLYRGVIQNRLREQLSVGPALVVTSVVFVLVHIQVFTLVSGLFGILLGFTALFLPSMVFGAVYEYTENIVVSALLHGIHNSLIITALFYGPSFLIEYVRA